MARLPGGSRLPRAILLTILVNNHRLITHAIDENLPVVRAGCERRVLAAGADGAAIESAFEAELARVAGDFVAEDADIVKNGLHAGREILGIAERAFELQIERGIVHQ